MSDRESGDDQPQGQNKYGQSVGMETSGSTDFDSVTKEDKVTISKPGNKSEWTRVIYN